MKNENYAKIKAAVRYWLLGRKYYLAHDAMEFGLEYHRGHRKDGVTPEFQHQLSQANYARTLESSLIYPEETLATIMLHDVVEDYDVSIETIHNRFGSKVGHAVARLTKTKPYTLESYFKGMELDPIASIVKGCDRMHNVQSMPGVFNHKKQLSYIEETETYILPMLKLARKRFPYQEPAYQNVKTMLQSQIELLNLTLESSLKND
jgi:(p)ppGpp synthase/HD superfamily hydrolase